MFLHKYKGLILAIVGVAIYIFVALYLQNLAYTYKFCIKIFAALLVLIGWVIVSETKHSYKKTEG
ncbi:hypothetical protein [Bacillus gaemokensis]|uniref:Uncharacterized protein n=1 Tax=Bacillus gaemokensis TaxID=574375 RepID=A0A073KFQ5_9BACI|nr:hypothetical protein [Bacillus gaemokensis]KEK25341.1 hypothetical protein BAGA_11995 [Bacillus gaemokensis]KYG37214.1 hypothetical protein AZF08_07340 [Bacillus gaemokensis]